MEIEILSMLQKIRTPLLDIFMSNITKLGNAGIVWILLTIVLLLIPKTRKSGLILASALIVDLILCNGILKPLIARIRPFDVNSAIPLYLAGEKKLWKIALVLAVLIAFSRLYLYVHYPTDVLGGIITGAIAGYIGYKLTFIVQSKHRKKL